MKSILENPFRLAGLMANASEKEIQKQKSKITKYASIGKQIDSEFDFPFLGKIDRSEESVKKAFSDIEQNHDKVKQALFWFLKTNPFDETSINYLINNDKEKAIEIWEKVTNGKEVNSKNFSCFSNIGTLKLLSDSKDEIREGLEAKFKMIESPSFTDFVHTVADQTYTIDNKRQAEQFVDDILRQFKGKFSSSDTIKLFNNCNGSTQKYLSLKFTEEPLHKIESQIESTRNKRKSDKSGAYELGLKLFVNCKDDLSMLKSLLGESDLKYKMVADNLAKEIMQCGIDYFKAWEDTKDPAVEGIKLLKHAKSIATSQQTIDRIDSNLEGMEEFKDKEITQAIDLLRSVKNAFESNKKKITADVMNMRLGYNQTINWTKVNEHIDNSLDWDKVVEFILEVIPQENIQKIKNHPDTTKINEYKSLVDFIFTKLNYTRRSNVKYLKYWGTIPDSSGTPISKGFPTWAWWVIGIIIFVILLRACES